MDAGNKRNIVLLVGSSEGWAGYTLDGSPGQHRKTDDRSDSHLGPIRNRPITSLDGGFLYRPPFSPASVRVSAGIQLRDRPRSDSGPLDPHCYKAATQDRFCFRESLLSLQPQRFPLWSTTRCPQPITAHLKGGLWAKTVAVTAKDE